MRRTSRWSSFLDGAVDGVVAAFALWTVVYEITLLGEWSLWVPAAAWVAAAVLLVAACGVLAVRRPQNDVRTASDVEEGPASAPLIRPVVLAASVSLLAVGAALRDWIGVWPVALVAIGVLGEGIRGLLRRVSARPGAPHRGDDGVDSAVSPWSDWAALGLCFGLAVFASLLRRPDADDVYYVNRSVWVEEHGPSALRDTMFGPETYPLAYGGGIPVPSIEGLLGALAHLLGVRAGTFCYLVAVPLLAFLLGWATWRLVREWAPRRQIGAFVLAVVFMVLSAETVVGDYGVGRIWQGKVIAFALLSPVIWVHLSRLSSSTSRRSVVMLFLAGIAFAGLTSGAALIGPVYAAAGLAAAAMLRQRALAVASLLLAVGPVASGVVAVVASSGIGGVDPYILDATEALGTLVGHRTPLAVVGLVGTVLAVRLLPPAAGVVASCASVVALACVLPGVLELVHAVTGAGAIAWRMLTVVPLAVLVGLLVSVRSPVAPWAGWALGASAALVLALFGKPLWVDEGSMTTRPSWKVDTAALDDVRAVTRIPTGRGPWLLPPEQMEVLSIYTTRRFAVVPRAFYLSSLEASSEEERARRLLLRAVAGDLQGERGPAVRQALARLEVALVCARASDSEVVELVDSLSAAPLRPVGSMVCLVRRPPGP